ncbi:MAG: hypothetical protein ACYTEX_26885 [Planctomycetota bacterium]
MPICPSSDCYYKLDDEQLWYGGDDVLMADKWHKPTAADRWTIDYYKRGTNGGCSGTMKTVEWAGRFEQWQDQNLDKIVVRAEGKRV